MAGHSHWKSIKHKKGAADARRGKVFSKLAKFIMLAARQGGGDLRDNLRLRYAVEQARAESMPKDSIERAIKKGTGELQGEELTELVYEGIGPGGIAFVIEALTDNRNRTGGEMRNLLEKRGGSLGKTNSVLWKFDRKGVLGVAADLCSEEELFEVAIEAGADDLVQEDDVFTIYTRIEDFEAVRSALKEFLQQKRSKPEKKWGEEEDESPVFTRSEFVYVPQSTVTVAEGSARAVLNLLGDLEDHDDVQNVYSDFDISEEILQEVYAQGER
jgi:YebC/PmpR family DNA-binding regulatory protein